MNSKKIGGWILSGLISAFLIFGSSMGKFTEWEGKKEMFDHLGYSSETLFKIGIVEACLAILYLVARVDFFAAILLTGYLGGATATHVRVGDPFYFPIVLGILMWIGLGLRNDKLQKFLMQR